VTVNDPSNTPSGMSPSGAPTALGSGAEFDIIRSIWSRLGARGANLGDDCAIVEVGGVRLAISSDLTLEDTHFRRGWLAPGALGWRAATAALSDLAAVAATPKGILISLGLSPELPADWAGELMSGVGEAAAEVGAMVWGGDVVRNDRIVIDAIVIGAFEADPVLRAGARAGDLLAVTGRLGGARAALEDLLGGRSPDVTAMERFTRPRARIAHAQWLRDRGARAMIDVSDGLVADAEHLAAASGLAAVIDRELIPLHPAAADSAMAASSGEEYELLVALPGDLAPTLVEPFAESFALPLTVVGVMEAGQGVTIRDHGHVVAESGRFSHF